MRCFSQVVAASIVIVLAAPVSAKVDVSGLDKTQEQNVRAHLSLSDVGCDAPAWLVRRQYRLAEAEIREALEALGFYDSRIDSALEFPKDVCWTARFEVDPREPVEIATLHVVVAEPLGSEKNIRERIRAADDLKGEVFDHGVYESYKESIAATAKSLGYFDAEFTQHRAVVDAGKREASITLELSAGTRYRFGPIAVTSEALTPELVRAFVPFKEGTYYNGTAVAQLRRDLNDSGYFGAVVVQAEPSTSGDYVVPVNIDVSAPNPQRVYSVGIGYATDTGIRLRGDVTNRLLNERGHRSGASLLLSPVRSMIDARYRLPHTNPIDDSFVFDAGLTREDTDTSKTDAKKVGARHIHDRGEWVETNFIDFALEDFEIAGEQSTSRLLMFGTSWTRTRADSSSRPMHGYRMTGEIRGATQALGSDNDFAQVRLNGKYIQALGERLRALARAEVGWTEKDDFSNLPPSVRFFAGGDNSIRGYTYQQLGPEENGEVVGGSRLMTGSLELDWPFLERWSVATFVDTGSAFDEEPIYNTGVGLGVRWYSPLGPIRVDIAHPLDSDDDFRFHVTVGPDL